MRVEVVGHRVGVPFGGGCSCYVVSDGSSTVLLDFGPGALERVWARGLIATIDAIVISHMHVDHMLDLLPFSGQTAQDFARQADPAYEPPALYVPRTRGPEVLDGLANAIGSHPTRFQDTFTIREYDEQSTVEVGALNMTFALTAHPERCYAVRISDGDTTLVYGADGAYDERLVRFAAGADLLLLEATFVDPGPELQRVGHMTGEQAGRVAREAGAGGLVISHVVPWPAWNEENLRRARAQFAGEAELAYEGAVFEVRPELR